MGNEAFEAWLRVGNGSEEDIQRAALANYPSHHATATAHLAKQR